MDTNILSPYVRRAIYSRMPAPRLFKDRVIMDYEIILVSGGEAYVTIEGKTYTARKNDVIFLPPQIPHQLEIKEGTFVQPHIHFDAVFDKHSYDRFVVLKPMQELTDKEKKRIQPHVLKDYNIPYVFAPDDPKHFHKHFFATIEAFANKREQKDLICRAHLLMLLQEIFRQFHDGSHKEDVSDYCGAVREYLDSNCDQVITLDELEKLFKVNKFTLIRNFKNAYGQSVIAYYNSRRAEFAKRILVKTEMPVTDVAANLNFPDIYSFSHFFKKHAGMSPTEYREQAK